MKTSIRTGLFSIAVAAIACASAVPVQAQSGLGTIVGVAFIDSNGNGKRDAGEATTLGRF